jgi:TonB-dependent receptor-like protein
MVLARSMGEIRDRIRVSMSGHRHGCGLMDARKVKPNIIQAPATDSSRQSFRKAFGLGGVLSGQQRFALWREGLRSTRVLQSVLTAVALGLVPFAGHSMAQTTGALPAPSVLKKLSVDDLLDIDVASVSKKKERLTLAPSAIQVITGEEIIRSGATSIPEALRLASNLTVAQVDSRQWAITSRGFNGTTANKLLVLIDFEGFSAAVAELGHYWALVN